MNVFDQMVARYSVGESTRNTTYEVMQEIICKQEQEVQ